jgi:hypothetical protein
MSDNIESFKAVVMGEVLSHRGSHGKELVGQFVTAIEREVARNEAKGLDAETLGEIRAVAQRAIARAKRDGVITAFEAA